MTLEKVVQAKASTIFPYLLDYNTWKLWHPLYFFESQLRLDISTDTQSVGSHFAWSGKHIGKGRITHRKIELNTKIEDQAEFRLKPSKLKGISSFELEETPAGTKVRFHLKAKLPLMFGLLAPRMIPYIAKNIRVSYSYGLEKLSLLVDPTLSPFSLEVVGTETVPAKSYVYLPFRGSFSDLYQAMSQGMKQLQSFAQERSADVSGPIFVYTEDLDQQKGWIALRMCQAVNKAENLPDGFLHTSHDAMLMAKAVLKGGYENLILSWEMFTMHTAMLYKSKMKDFPKIEFYTSYPQEKTPPVTSLYIPLDL